MTTSKKTRSRNKSRKCNELFFMLSLVAAVLVAIAVIATSNILWKTTTPITKTIATSTSTSTAVPNDDYRVDDSCKNLPTIRHSGTYFLDGTIKAGDSPKGLEPPFKVGSYFAAQVKLHMSGDLPNFRLMKNFLKGKEGGLAFDMGANQGFYSYYLATLGMQVHSFEINEKNFKALQHGSEFNSKEVADRVHLYPVGLGQKNARFSMNGANYDGFLKEGHDGPILGVTFDCFAYHMRSKLGISNVAFVKLDVEGFEIAVLKGAQNSLFKPGTFNVGAMIVEVGPDRWGRASVDLATGVEEMKKLSTHFKESYILIRGDKQCSTALTEGVLSDKAPKTIDGVNMFTVEIGEWGVLLAKMEKTHNDCNFFFKN